MKKGLRIGALILALLMVLGFFVTSFASATEQWDKDVYAYGAGLDEQEIEQTAKLLGITNMDSVNKVIVNSQDLFKYVKEESSDSGMISSIFAKKTSEGSGTEVIITTPKNITHVSELEYTNAALTAGVSDAKIYVGAIRPVTGTSALTGVYKAFELNGETLDEQRVEVANEELETVNAIVQEHKDDENFTVEQINNVVVYVKEALITNKEKTDEKATEGTIRNIINEGIQKYELNNIITQVNIDKLVVYFQNFQNSSAIDSEELKDQLSKWGNTLREKAGELTEKAKDLANDAKDYVNSEEAQGLFSRILQFLGDIFTRIGDFFKGLVK
ncbi:MAG: DUF1002 domain-containing protein [Tissierellia bacterium]|nr:DUF1002 domain-containing protein [Tissierellia bacterium]